MKKKMTYLFLVMTVMAGTLTTACSSSDDEPATPVQKANTLTVEAGMSDNITRALEEAEGGTTLAATWAEGDEVKVYEGERLLGTLTPQTTGNATTKLVGELTQAPSASGVELTLKYKETNYSGQDGTLAKIGSTYNYCKATTTVTQSGNQYSGTPATFVSQQAIVKFTLKKKSDESVIKAKTMNIRYTGYSSTILSLTNLTVSNSGEYYIALPPTNNDRTLTITVNDGTRYEIEAPATAFAAGAFYRRNVLFTYNEINIFGITGDTGYTVATGQHELCRGTNNVGSKLVLEDGSTATLDNIDIRSYDNDYGIQCDGNATIILKDGTENTITGASAQALNVASDKTLTIEGTGKLILIGNPAVSGNIIFDESKLQYEKNTDTEVIISKKEN